MGSQFRSAFSKFCKRERSPSSGLNTESRSKSRSRPVTSRPPAGYRREPLKESTPEPAPKTSENDLDARLNKMRAWQSNQGAEKDELEGSGSEAEDAGPCDENEFLGDQ